MNNNALMIAHSIADAAMDEADDDAAAARELMAIEIANILGHIAVDLLGEDDALALVADVAAVMHENPEG